MAQNSTASQPENQPGGVNGRSHPPAGESPPPAYDPGFTDSQFRMETPDVEAAQQWFAEVFSPAIEGIRCQRCAWNEPAKPSAPTASQPYWCPRCRRHFSIKTGTVMHRSLLDLRQWKHALFVWTGGPLPSTSEELARRVGVNEGTAHDITLRILKATEEDLPPLREPAEMAWFKLGGNPVFRHRDKQAEAARKPPVFAIAMVGRCSGRTFIERMEEVKKENIQGFIDRHLEPGMDLHLSNHSAHQGISRATLHHLSQPASSYLLQDLKERIRTAFVTRYNWVSDRHMAEYLTGLQWWENHRHLDHREKMRQLALGMKWKTPPYSRSERKRRKKRDQPTRPQERARSQLSRQPASELSVS